jgi:hypothetical protein
MYAYLLKTEHGFFEGVCAPCNATAYFSDPPPTGSRFANRVPPAPVAARANGADDIPSAPSARSGINESLAHKLVYVVVVAVLDKVVIE